MPILINAANLNDCLLTLLCKTHLCVQSLRVMRAATIYTLSG